jgi:hypothetical protein
MLAMQKPPKDAPVPIAEPDAAGSAVAALARASELLAAGDLAGAAKWAAKAANLCETATLNENA